MTKPLPEIEIALVAEMAVINPFDFFLVFTQGLEKVVGVHTPLAFDIIDS